MTNLLPAPARWIALAGIAIVMYLLGMLHGERTAGQEHIDYVEAQAKRGLQVANARARVVVKTEVKYRDRIRTIYVKGEEIEKQVPVLVTPDDDLLDGVSVGFVRSFNAAWSGDAAGPAADSDRESAGIPLAEVAEADAHNAKSCRAWRELALGLREYYEAQQAVSK
jgi:hypothetical protein